MCSGVCTVSLELLASGQEMSLLIAAMEEETRKYTCIKITSAPHSARETATACPIPLVPPVIIAVWPSRENIAIVAEVAMLKSDLNSTKCVFL